MASNAAALKPESVKETADPSATLGLTIQLSANPSVRSGMTTDQAQMLGFVRDDSSQRVFPDGDEASRFGADHLLHGCAFRGRISPLG